MFLNVLLKQWKEIMFFVVQVVLTLTLQATLIFLLELKHTLSLLFFCTTC